MVEFRGNGERSVVAIGSVGLLSCEAKKILEKKGKGKGIIPFI